jgi:hypothetical protein
MELLFTEIALGTQLSQIPYDMIHHLATESRVRSTCLFMHEHGLDLHHDITQAPLRINDRMIMRVFLSLSPSVDELKALHRCRLYLQVFWLSEISTGDGLMITEDAWQGKRFKIPVRIQTWPFQQLPPSSDWSVWQRFVKQGILHRGLRLKHEL